LINFLLVPYGFIWLEKYGCVSCYRSNRKDFKALHLCSVFYKLFK
ncbi:Hypothetical Protein PAU_03385, partial [Photorhabdus asymbiotica]